MNEVLGYKIERNRVPCIYDISYRKGNSPRIVLRLHKDFVKANKDISRMEFFLRKIQDDHSIGEFFPLSNDCFGFDGVIKKKRKKSFKGFFIYEIEIPVFKKDLPETCERCNGTGQNKDLDCECLFCHGSGHKSSYDWRPLTAISASLQVLGMMINTYEKETSAKNPQLITFQLYCGKGQGHFPIAGYYGIDFCNWLVSLNAPHVFDQVIEEMQHVYSHIYGREIGMRWDFQAYLEKNAWLIISVPGDACGIHPSDSYGWKQGEGKAFDCHNMDSPAQQIMILVALAILSDMARKYLKG